MKTRYRIGKLAFLIAVDLILIFFLFTSCTETEEVSPPLQELVIGNWTPTVYKTDPNEQQWRELGSLTRNITVSFSEKDITILEQDKYSQTSNRYQIKIERYSPDTLMTGTWITEPWDTFEENSALFRLGESNKERSIWLQNGNQQIILVKED